MAIYAHSAWMVHWMIFIDALSVFDGGAFNSYFTLDTLLWNIYYWQFLTIACLKEGFNKILIHFSLSQFAAKRSLPYMWM